MKAIDCGMLIDGLADEPVYDAVVLIAEDGRIRDAGPSDAVSVPAGADRIDHSSQVVTPGFIDLHLHLNGTRSFKPMERISLSVPHRTARATGDLKRLLRSGFTSVRDIGSAGGLGLREAVNEGEISGPRIHTAGSPFGQTAGHVEIHSLPYEWASSEHMARSRGRVADGVEECRKQVRKELRRGVDVIKILTSGGMSTERDDPNHAHYTADEVRVFTEEAHRLGVPVAAHAESAPGIKLALENGVDTIEHGIGIDDEGIELAHETGAIVVTTVSAIYRLAYEGHEHGLPEYHVEKGKDHIESHIESIERAYEAGVPLAHGTDCNGSTLHPHGDNGIEFELMVDEVGMDEMEAIKAGTSVAAEALASDEVGAVVPDRYADMVVLDENPLDDIHVVRDQVDTVYRGGDEVDC